VLWLYQLNFQQDRNRRISRNWNPHEIDSFARSYFDRDRLCSRCRRTRSLIFTVAMNAWNTSSRGADYTKCSFRRGRERGTVTCNKCDCFINLSACVGRREKPRSRALLVFGRCWEKERVKRDSREKGHISEIFPEFSELRLGTDSTVGGFALRAMHLYIHRVVTDLENRENREKLGKLILSWENVKVWNFEICFTISLNCSYSK